MTTVTPAGALDDVRVDLDAAVSSVVVE